MVSAGQPARRRLLKEMATISLGLAKTSAHFVGLDASGQVLTRHQCSKAKLVQISAKLGPCRIGMDACCGAHHLGC